MFDHVDVDLELALLEAQILDGADAAGLLDGAVNAPIAEPLTAYEARTEATALANFLEGTSTEHTLFDDLLDAQNDGTEQQSFVITLTEPIPTPDVAVPIPTPPGGNPDFGWGRYYMTGTASDYGLEYDQWEDAYEDYADGSGTYEDTQLLLNNAPTECAIDMAANAVAAQIRAMNSTIEHGAILVARNGQVTALQIIHGNSGALNAATLFNTIDAGGYSMDEVVGYIHNHPTSTISDPNWAADDNNINRAPSNNDFAFASFLSSIFAANESSQSVSIWNSRFSIYIIGPDGTLREYDGVTNPNFPSTGITDAQANAAAIDAAGTGCTTGV